MNELTKTTRKTPEKRGLGEISPQERLRAAVRKVIPETYVASSEVALLLDRSGSMYGDPMRKLREAIRDFKHIRKFQYSDTTQELMDGQEVQNPGARGLSEDGEYDGNNNEPRAFETLKNAGIKHCVLVTDGYPDNPAASLIAAKGLKIDIIYIGPPPPPKFLEDLAKATGGSYDGSVSFAAQDGSRQLTSRIKGLLPAPEDKKGVIAL